MSIFSNPFDSKTRLRCSCGQHASEAEHEASISNALARNSEALSSNVVEQAVMLCFQWTAYAVVFCRP